MNLTAEEIASFDGRYSTGKLNGPRTLMRLTSPRADPESRYGRYWFDATFFWSVVNIACDHRNNAHLVNHYLRYLLREQLAICHDWSPALTSIFELTGPAGLSVEVAIGPVRPQPFFSAKHGLHRTCLPHEVLVGGEFQFIVDLASNPVLRAWVHGPRPLWASRAGRA